MLVIVHLLLLNSKVEGVWLDEEVARFKSYYTCYYNQYLQIKPHEDNPKRKKFVASLLEDALEKKDEVPPTEACVSWICDPSLVWRRTIERDLEIWAYFALEGRSILAWGKCFEDQQEEFKRNNYSVHAVGVHSIVHLSDDRLRLFYVPSTECYKKGPDLVSEVVAVLAGNNSSSSSLDRVYSTFCQDDLSIRGGNEKGTSTHGQTKVFANSTEDAFLEHFCPSIGLGKSQCTWDTILVFLYMLAAVLLFNIFLLSCIFRKRLSELLSRLCGLDMEVPTHMVKEGYQVLYRFKYNQVP